MDEKKVYKRMVGGKMYIIDQQKHNKNYYKKNKDKLKELINCECGGKYRKYNKSKHFKTKKHLKYLENKEEEIAPPPECLN